jgi:hypothetical protein
VSVASRLYGTRKSLQRLREMSLTEIAVRSQQQASKLLDRLAPATGTARPGRSPIARRRSRRRMPRCAGSRSARLDDSSPASKTSRRRRTRCVSDCPRTAATSSRRRPTSSPASGSICSAIAGLSFGDPIDWHLDPVWSRQSPRVHWSQINTLDPAVVGDSKVVWELNRHQWVVRPRTGVGAHRRRALRQRRDCRDRFVARREPARHRRQLGQQPRSVVPADLVELDAAAAPHAAVADRRMGDEAAVGDLAARVARQRYLSYYFRPTRT